MITPSKTGKVGRPAVDAELKSKVISFTLAPKIINRLLQEQNRSAVVTLALLKHYRIKP